MHINEHGLEIIPNKISSSVMNGIKSEVNNFTEDYPGHGIRNADKKINSINEITATQEAYFCEVHAGDLVIMKPHILHSSSKAVNPDHRRVVHIEYSIYELAENLTWA